MEDVIVYEHELIALEKKGWVRQVVQKKVIHDVDTDTDVPMYHVKVQIPGGERDTYYDIMGIPRFDLPQE